MQVGSAFEDLLIVPEETFANGLRTALDGEIYSAVWYKVLDSSSRHYEQANARTHRIRLVNRLMTDRMEGMSTAQSPEESVAIFQREAQQLTILLYAFSVPSTACCWPLLSCALTCTWSGSATKRPYCVHAAARPGN